MLTNYKKYALIIGISLLLMAIVAGYAYGYIFNGFISTGDDNFLNTSSQNAKSLYISGIFAWIIIFILDLMVSWGLCKYYQRVHPLMSFINSGLRILYTLILGLAIVILIQNLSVFSGPSSLSEKMNAIQSALMTFEKIWSYGLIIFGLHLMVWGTLSLKAAFIHNAWGILFIFAGISYSFIHFSKSTALLSLETITTIEQVFMLPMTLAEVGFAIWLVVKRK